VNDQRIARFKEKITKALEGADLATFRGVIEQYEQEHGVPALDIAAALARMAQGDNPLLVPDAPKPPTRPQKPDRPPQDRARKDRPPFDRPQPGRSALELGSPFQRAKRPGGPPSRSASRPPEVGTTRYRLAVGHVHGVKPGNIVGAIANEAGVDSRSIGRVDIRDDHSLVDLPAGMPDKILQHLKQVWVVGQQLRIVPDGQPFDAPRKTGKLALGDEKPGRRKPGKGLAHAFPPRKPLAKAGGGKGKSKS
jgi:ATP-dependent RNA helicase DeaD